MFQLALYLLADLHGLVADLFALVLAEVELLGPDGAGLLHARRDGCEVVVGAQVPEEGAADADEGTVREHGLALLDDGQRLLVDHDLMVASLDEASRKVLDLLARLDQEVVALGDLDGDLLARVARPDVQAGVARAAVDGEEVEVCVEAGEDGILLAVLLQVRGRRGEEVGAVRSCQSGGWTMWEEVRSLLTRTCRRLRMLTRADPYRLRPFRRLL